MDLDAPWKLLEGAIDLHVHTSPDAVGRHFDDVQLAVRAKALGMRAVLLRHHFTGTADRAALATQITGLPVFGGILLDNFVGGLNLAAAEGQIRMGGKLLNFPTLHSRHLIGLRPNIPDAMKWAMASAGEGISLIDAQGELTPEARAVIALAKDREQILDSGYVSKAESAAMLAEALRLGHDKVVISNPLSSIVNLSVDDVADLVKSHAGVYVEHSAIHYSEALGHPRPLEDLVSAIKRIGPERTVLTSDGGLATAPSPFNLLAALIERLGAAGISAADMRLMLQRNPARLLGLES